MNIALSILSIIGTISSVVFAFLAFFRKEKESNVSVGKKGGELSNDIFYIKTMVDNIKTNLEKVEDNYNQLNIKFVKLD